MIVDLLENSQRYVGLHERFAAAFDFLRTPNLAELDSGKVELQGEQLFAIMRGDKSTVGTERWTNKDRACLCWFV